MKKILIFSCLLMLFSSALFSQVDPPSGYTVYHGFRMYDEGDYPTADSVNQNLIDIDDALHGKDLRIDSLKTSFSAYHHWPSGKFKNPMNLYYDLDLEAYFIIQTPGIEYRDLYFGTGNNTRLMIHGDTITLGNSNTVGNGDLFANDVVLSDGRLITGTNGYVSTGDLYISGIPNVGNDMFWSDGDDEMKFWLKESDHKFYIYSNSGTVTTVMFKDPSGSYSAIDAGTYKASGTTAYLSSAFGSLTPSGYYIVDDGGVVNAELNYVNLTINGITRQVLVKDLSP